MFATNDPFAHLRSKQPMDPQEGEQQQEQRWGLCAKAIITFCSVLGHGMRHRRMQLPLTWRAIYAPPHAVLCCAVPCCALCCVLRSAMRLWQEQMLKSRQLVLAQQAKSAVQQANKAQRELYIGNLAAGQVTEGMLQQVFNSALIAAFPDAGKPGCEPVIKVRGGAVCEGRGL